MKIINKVQINGEAIHVFDYICYFIKSAENDYRLNIELVVSEVVAKKYYRHGQIDVQLTYENEEVEMLIMDIDYLEEVSGDAEIPIMELGATLTSIEGYEDIKVYDDSVIWNEDRGWPRVTPSVTIEDIRRVEMPDEEIDISMTLTLPIDLTEWIHKNNVNFEEILKEALYEYRKNIVSE